MSSPRQALLQAKHLIQTAAWADGATEPVVGTSTNIAAGLDESAALPKRLPFVLIGLGGHREDDEEPLLIEQDISVILAAAVGGHPFGEHAIVGGPGRQPGTSKGRGLVELQVPILTQLRNLYSVDNTVAKIVPGSSDGARWRSGQYMAWRQYIVTVLCSVADEYPAPSELAVSGNVLSWTLPPPRFDLESIILRYASGGTAPASATAGTGIALDADLSTSDDVSALGAGTYSFALFARYQDVNPSDFHYSSQKTGTTRLSVEVT